MYVYTAQLYVLSIHIGFNREFTRSNFIIEGSFRDFQTSFWNRNSCLPGSRPAAAGQELHLREIERKTGFAIGTARQPGLEDRIKWD